jgi:hypothetical protein
MKRSTSLAAALCFILGTAFSATGHAAPGPRFIVPDRTATTGVLPQRLATADFNQDGHNDVAVANLGPDAFVGGVDVMLGDGKGRLGDPIRTPLGAQTGAYQVAAGDFNGDGKADLAALTGTTGGYGPIVILLGRGDGSFDTGPSSLAAGEGNIAVADLTGDGKADIVFVFTRSAQLKLFKGKGDGSFAAPIVLDRDFGAYDIELGDVNGDGRPDIVGAAGGPIWSMLNLGGGDFGPQVFQASPELSGFKLALADFNGDGKLDVAAVNASGGAVQIGLGTGTGAFAPFQVYEDVSFATTWIAAADWTGDGRADLVVNNEYASESNTVVLMKGQGDGSFGDFSYWVTGNDDPTPVQLDGDGLMDLLAFSSDAGRVYATLNAGNGRFKAPRSQPVKGVGTASKADVDGDGHLDIVMMGVVLPRAGELAVEVFTYLNDGKGHFKKAVVSRTINVEAGDGIGEIVLADVNEDGQLDLVAGFVHLFPKAGNVWVLLGDGTGKFGKLAVYSTGEVHASNDSIAVADVTGDGHLDIVGHTLSQLAVLPGDGQGHFGAPIASGDSTSSQVRLLIADFTLDGIPDAVAVIRTGGPDFGKGDLRLQKGLGDGRFQLIQTLSYDGNPNDAVLADLNGDGRPDVGVSATRGSNGGRSGLRISLDQDGQLGPIAFYPSPPFPGGPIEAADFDLDGDIDIAGGAAGAIAIALNDGQGVFAGPFVMISATSGERIAGDFTGDGKPDLVTVNVTNRAQLALFVNSTRR